MLRLTLQTFYPMRYLNLLALVFCLFPTHGFSQQWLWSRHSSGNQMVQPYAVAADAYGNVYAAGSVAKVSNSNQVTITIGNISHTVTAPASTAFGYLIKINGAGQPVWLKAFTWVSSMRLATDPSGNVIVAGCFNSDTLIMGNLVTLKNGGTMYGESPFLAKFDSAGNALWARAPEIGNAQQTSLAEGRTDAVTTDAQGNIIITGNYTASSLKFDGQVLAGSGLFSTGGYKGSAFVVKYNSSGVAQWANQASGNELYLNCPGAATDAAGNIFIGGRFMAPVLTVGGFSITNHGSLSFDIFLAKLSPSGSVLWAKGAGGNYFDDLWSAATDAAGNLYICGGVQSNPAHFDGFTTTIKNGSSASDIYLAKYDNATGACRWVRDEGGSCVDAAKSVAVFGNQYVYLGGVMGSGGSHTSVFGNITVANPNQFIVQYDTAGTVLGATVYGAEDGDQKGIAVNPQGQLFVLGEYKINNFQIGNDLLPLTSYPDMYLSKYSWGTVNGISGASKLSPSVYPNPGEGLVHIDQLEEMTGYRLINAPGAVVLEGRLRPGNHVLSFRELPAGLYLLELTGTDGRRFTQRLVKQ